MSQQAPRFRLFRLTQPMHNGCTHAGEVWVGGRMWTITARVVETETGRQFHGDVTAPGESIRKSSAPPKDDLVAQAEGSAQRAPADSGLPFDDKLPEAM